MNLVKFSFCIYFANQPFRLVTILQLSGQWVFNMKSQVKS